MNDPNATYVPQPYPKRLYRDHQTSIVVNDEAEHKAAVADGYVLFTELPDPPAPNEFTGKGHAQLVEMMVALGRAKLMAMSSEEVIASIKAFRAAQEPAADPLDHDHDGHKGGAVDVDDKVAKLRADLDALGVPYDKRWREARLTQALDEATKA